MFAQRLQGARGLLGSVVSLLLCLTGHRPGRVGKKGEMASPAVPEPIQPGRGEENGNSPSPEEPGEEQASSPYLHARRKLENLLNKSMRIRMTDGRTLVGCFLCTDRDCNVILGSAQEYLKPTDSFSAGEPRVLGLAMVPGHHIVSIEVELESLTSLQYL